MDFAAPFSPAKSRPMATPGSLLIRARLSSGENESPLTSDASEVEEGFETASEPEEDIHDFDLAAAPKVGMFPRSSSMLIKAKLTRDDDPDEDASVEDLEEEDEDEDMYGTARVPTSEYKGELLESEGIKTSTEILVLPATKEDVEVESSGEVPDDKHNVERSSQDGDLAVQEKEIVEDANLQRTKEILTEDEDSIPDADQDGDLVVQEKEIVEDANLQRTKEILTEDEGAAPDADQDGHLVVQEKERAEDANLQRTKEILTEDEDAVPDAEEHNDNLVEPDQAAEFSKEHEREEVDCLVSGGPMAALAISQVAKEMIKVLHNSSSGDGSKDANDVLILDSDEEVVTNEEDTDRLTMEMDALMALLKAASSSSGDGKISASQDVHRIFTVDHPTGLGSSIPSLKPAAPRLELANTYIAAQPAVTAGHDTHKSEEQIKLHEKVELIKVKFLRLLYRLGLSPEGTIPSAVLHRLSLAEGIGSGRQTNQAFKLESLKEKALQLEQDGREGFDFSCNILVLGKSGVGKSATINSIFGEERSQTNPFKPASFSIKQIVGTVDGVTIRLTDTPGLGAAGMDQVSTRRILTSIKKYIKRCPPDVVLYVDRMDTLTRDQNDLPLLRTITSTLGPSIWFKAIITLTHATSALPDGPSGSPLSYEVFVSQRTDAVRQSIWAETGDMGLMNPIAFVENHPSCGRNNEGQRVLPSGLPWRSQLLMLCYSSKILSEAKSLKFQEASPSKLFSLRFPSPPLSFLLSSLLQARSHPKLPSDQGGDYGDSDMDLDDLSDADQEEAVNEYDQLPSFKPLKKSQISKLTKEQRRAYFDEYEYRIKLLQKKQWKEELRRLKEMKTRQKKNHDYSEHADLVDDFEQDNAPATIPVPLPDMVLPPSFDCDSPTYRYRFLEPTSQILARPVLNTHGWDHDCGYDGVGVEENLVIAGRFPAVLSAQVTKDKKGFNIISLDSAISAKHGENGSTLAGFDIQAMGKQFVYILRGETKFKTLKRNRTTGGFSITFLGETVATGLKLEDQLSIGKQLSLVANTGAVRAQGDTACGANLEARIRGKDYPISQALLTLGLSLITMHGKLALGANLQSQVPIGRNTKMAVSVGLNNKMTGQVSVKASTSEQLQLALMGIVPIAISIFRRLRSGESSA